jgi:hypothetical protein
MCDSKDSGCQFGLGVLNFMFGNPADMQNTNEVINKISVTVNNTIQNTVNRIIQTNNITDIKNLNNLQINAISNCRLERVVVNQNINNMAKITVDLLDTFKAQISTDVQTAVQNEFKITDKEERGILDYVARIFGVTNKESLKQEISNQFKNIISNTFKAENFTNNGTTINNNNVLIINCQNSTIIVSGVNQNINTVLIAQLTIRVLTEIFANSSIMNRANSKVEYFRERTEAPGFIWLISILGIITAIVIIIAIIIIVIAIYMKASVYI